MNFEDELQEKTAALPQEREISLGTGTILGIFLVLVLVCAAFFGFGYSMGRRSNQAAVASPDSGTTAKTEKADSPFSNFKAAPVADTATPSAAGDATTPKADTPPATEAAKAPAAEATGSSAAEAPATVVQPTVSSDGSWMVQVSATTRKPDAEALTKVLVGKGFTTNIKQDADQKFHVRVGPYASKKDADITRKLLVASGYKDPFLTPR